mgnify:CR=1 FL=1
MNALEYGFANALIGREDKFPFLARAVANMEFATHPRIEWWVRPKSPDMDELVAWRNDCEIVQTTFLAGSSLDEALETHLAEVQQVILDGKGDQSPPSRRCTGARVLLGREPTLKDDVRLRPGRDLRLHLNVNPYYDSPIKNRWISEVSVQVRPWTAEYGSAEPLVSSVR